MKDDPDFDRLMEEIFPMSIPTDYVESILVTLASGQKIIMSGDELLQPLPLADDLSWEKLVHRFDKIADVQVKINVKKIKKDVQTNVMSILGEHFDADIPTDVDDSKDETYTLTKGKLEDTLGPFPIKYDEDNPPDEDDFDLPDDFIDEDNKLDK
tara:strand:- start:805 stop:1269 length:465 start_codon:yes stop_codon:yes gene_type:complete